MSYIYIFPLLMLFLSILWVVQYRKLSSVVEKIREGCFILLPKHAAPKFISLNERSFDLERIPTHFFLLLFLHEDDRFLTHKGFHHSEIRLALIDYIFKGKVRGGSSITQQTAKALFTRGERSFKRKLVESIGAVALERLLTKEEILYLYLFSLRLVSIVSSLPDIADYLLGIENLSDLSIAESELIASLIPAPKSRISKIKKLGLVAFDFSYSYEKILVLTRILLNNQLVEGGRGFVNHLVTLQSALMEYGTTYSVESSNNREMDCIVNTAIILRDLEKSLNRIALRSLPKIGPKFLLAKWQLALIHILDDNQATDLSFRNLSEKDQAKIVHVAKKNHLLGLFSAEKIRLYGLKNIAYEVKLNEEKVDNKINLDIHKEQLIANLSKDEIADEVFCAPNFANTIEQFFSLT